MARNESQNSLGLSTNKFFTESSHSQNRKAFKSLENNHAGKTGTFIAKEKAALNRDFDFTDEVIINGIINDVSDSEESYGS